MYNRNSGLCEDVMVMRKWGIILICCFVWIIYMNDNALISIPGLNTNTIKAKDVELHHFGLWVDVETTDGRELRIPISSIKYMEEKE